MLYEEKAHSAYPRGCHFFPRHPDFRACSDAAHDHLGQGRLLNRRRCSIDAFKHFVYQPFLKGAFAQKAPNRTRSLTKERRPFPFPMSISKQHIRLLVRVKIRTYICLYIPSIS